MITSSGSLLRSSVKALNLFRGARRWHRVSRPRVLFLATDSEDYLQDGCLYGLRQILGSNCIDYPRKDVMYQTCERPDSDLYGRGFTMWKLLPDVAVDREDIVEKISRRYYDLIVFGSVCRQKQLIKEIIPAAIRGRTQCVFLDGEDSPGWRSTQFLGTFGHYFKREGISRGRLFAQRINFVIPSAKIVDEVAGVEKTYPFAKHVQCGAAYAIPWIEQHCQSSYAFRDEFMYRENLAQSEYAITMAKDGWDCMRHYEIAASGTVNAFYRLNEKPPGCGPHGLIDMVNAIAFDSADELVHKIELIRKRNAYDQLRRASLEWANANSCENLARTILQYSDITASDAPC